MKKINEVKDELFALNKICKEFISNNQNISVDSSNPDELFWEYEINAIKENLSKIIDDIDYLNQPIAYESHVNLTVGEPTTESFVAENGETIKRLEIIEYLQTKKHLQGVENSIWTRIIVGHLDDYRAKNLNFRKRELKNND